MMLNVNFLALTLPNWNIRQSSLQEYTLSNVIQPLLNLTFFVNFKNSIVISIMFIIDGELFGKRLLRRVQTVIREFSFIIQSSALLLQNWLLWLRAGNAWDTDNLLADSITKPFIELLLNDF